jgi:hypothetical protein
VSGEWGDRVGASVEGLTVMVVCPLVVVACWLVVSGLTVVRWLVGVGLSLGVAPSFELVLGLVLALGVGLGDSLGDDITGLSSGVGDGFDDCFGLAVCSSPHGAAVFLAELADEDEDGDEVGLEVAVAELVALAVADAVELAGDETLGLALGDGVLDGELDGELEADADGDGTHDATGTAAALGAGDGCWLPSEAGWLFRASALCAGTGAGLPDTDAPATTLAAPLFALPPPGLELCPDSTVELSCTIACRSGGTASATPAANTAQANARAGRSIMSRRSQRLRRLRVRLRAPGLSNWDSPAVPDTVREEPERIFARMRSRPSGRGSTCSAAACNAERTSSAKSCG